MSVRRSGDGFDITTSVDREWLAKQDYPVVLDPTVTFGPANSTIVDADFPISATACGSGPCGVNQDGFLRVGPFGDIWRSAVRFDLSVVPRGAKVTSANYHHVLFGCSDPFGCPTEPLELRRIDGSWSTASSGKQIADATGTTVAATGPNASNDYNLTAQTQRWISRADPNNGISLQLAGEASATIGAAYYSSRGPGRPDPRTTPAVPWRLPGAAQRGRVPARGEV
jgi:hypothetical protein